MQTTQFQAFCPYEIGDKLIDTKGNQHTITDIAAIHYCKTKKVEFRYEIDNSGKYQPIGTIRIVPVNKEG